MIEGVLLTPLKIIGNKKGDIYHALKASSPGYEGFGEAYFSTVEKGAIKGWKRHNRMTLNLVVPVGEIQFILYDDRINNKTSSRFYDASIGIDGRYQRLTIPPRVWVAFRGVSDFNVLLNIIAEEHDVSEVDSLDLNAISIPKTINI